MVEIRTLKSCLPLRSLWVTGTRTYDTLRYAETGGFPLRTTFTDESNRVWVAQLDSEADQMNIMFPCMDQILWHGDEDDRTGLDAQSNLCNVQFSYQEPGGFH